MNHGRENRFPTVVPVHAEVENDAPSESSAELAVVVTTGTRLRRVQSSAYGHGSSLTAGMPVQRLRWTRPRRHLERRIARRPEEQGRIPFPRIPEGIPDEEGTSLGALATVLVAFHRTVPLDMRDEYVRQVMKFAGEKAGQMVRISLERA